MPEADSIARGLLDSAWPRYPGVMDRIRGGGEALRPEFESTLRAIASVLGADTITVRMSTYVGALEHNAFFNARNGVLSVLFPVEAEPEWRQILLPHELAHAVHHRLAGFSEGWERTIARTLFAEGLASRAAQAVLPGRPDGAYVEHRAGWYAQAAARDRDILRGIAPALRADDSETVMRFTMGRGTTGLEREAYYAGWRVVGHLLERGWTMAELARLSEDEIPAVVEQAIEELLRETNG